MANSNRLCADDLTLEIDGSTVNVGEILSEEFTQDESLYLREQMMAKSGLLNLSRSRPNWMMIRN